MNSEEALRDLFEKSERENAAVDLEDVLPIVKQAKKEGRIEGFRQLRKEFDQVYEAFL